MLNVAEIMFPVSARSGLIARMSDIDSREGVLISGPGARLGAMLVGLPMTATLKRFMKSLPSFAPVSILFWKVWPSRFVESGPGDAAMAWSTSCLEK
jgi:hypothetical protein